MLEILNKSLLTVFSTWSAEEDKYSSFFCLSLLKSERDLVCPNTPRYSALANTLQFSQKNILALEPPLSYTQAGVTDPSLKTERICRL